MSKRARKGQGGILQRHDHPTCPKRVAVGTDENGKTIWHRPEHTCQGRWVGTVDVEMPDGTTKRKYVYASTLKELTPKHDEIREQKRKGTLTFDQGMTVGQWFEHWMKLRRKPPKPLKPQTWNGYQSHINNWIVPHLGKRQLSALRPAHVDALYDVMREAGRKEGTVRQVHAILSTSLKFAFRKGMIPVNPMERVTPPGTETDERDQFTLEQARQALMAAGDSARWWLAIFYGMRQGECLGLRWEDVDFGAHTLSVAITDQDDYERAGRIEGDPKSRAGKRTLPMVGQIEVRMRLLWEEKGRPQSGKVFTNSVGRALDPKADWNAWRAFLDSAASVPFAPLPYIALHAARNTAASLMEAAGISDRMVAQILGHAQVKMTHRYQDAELARVRAELERAERLLTLPQASAPAPLTVATPSESATRP